MSKINDNDSLLTIIFKLHPTINEKKTKEAGRPIYDEIEVCQITSAGNKQTMWVMPAHDFTGGFVDDPLTGLAEQQTYAQKYNKQYLAFKDGNAQVQNGTPLEALPFLTPAKVLELKALHIHTAESLAAIDGQPIKQLGIGGRDLKDKAVEYLENATGPAALAIQQETNRKLLDQMEKMQAQLNAIKSPIEKKSAFEDFEDEDIKNWLTDAGVTVHHLWKHKRLIEEAEKKNGELASKEKIEAA